MSPSVYITTRVVKSGRRYVVRYRRGGRMTKLEHAGSFATQRDAQARKAFVSGLLAAGRDPAVALRELAAPSEVKTLHDWCEAFIASRVDVGAKTRDLYGNARDRLGELAERDPSTLRVSDLQTWLAANAELAPGSLKHYLSTIRQVLDFADVEPNPAASKRLRLPSEDSPEVSPPSTAEWDKIKAQLWKRSLLPLRLVEALGLRIAEATDLTYGDIDFAEGRLRISRSRTKRRTAGQRWLPVPAALLDEIAELCPLEDRSRERRVFPLKRDAIRGDLSRACRDAGIPHYHPHDLRHRRVSLWFAHGFDQITVKTWAGHARASMSSDVYGHVVIDPDGDEWRQFWLEAYEQERRPKRAQALPGEVPVRSKGGDAT